MLEPVPMDKTVENNINYFNINSRKPFRGQFNLTSKQIEDTFIFSYEMAFQGLHREFRSGVIKIRSNIEIFIDIF